MTLSDFNVLAKWSYGRPLCDSLDVYETARTLLEIHPFLAAINFHLANFDPQSLTARLKLVPFFVAHSSCGSAVGLKVKAT